MNGRETLVWPQTLLSVEDAELQAFLANQEARFVMQRRALDEKRAIFRRRSDQIRAEIEAVGRENAGLREQLELLREDVADKELLLAKGLMRESDLRLLKRQQAEIRARIASNEAVIARAGQRIGEMAIAAAAADTEFHDTLAAELARIGSELAPLEEQVAASEDIVRRTEIVAPVSGTVINLRMHTAGGIVRAGEPILDIVPRRDDLVIEARLAPDDIDSVQVGQRARVHLTPYAARNMPPLEGRLIRVDPDSSVDAATRERYYEIRVAVDPSHSLSLDADVKLAAGMPAEVYIDTGERSFLSYLAAPVIRSFRRAFRET